MYRGSMKISAEFLLIYIINISKSSDWIEIYKKIAKKFQEFEESCQS